MAPVGQIAGMAGFMAAALMLATPHGAIAQDLSSFRAPNALEQAYAGLAADLDRPDLCRRISPQAVHRVRKPSLARSRCFYYLAINQGDLNWCDEVRPIPASAGLMNWLDPDRCRFQVDRLQGAGKGFSVKFDVAHLLQEMGYGADDLPVRFRRNGQPDWQGYYDSVRHSATATEFVGRLAALPDFSVTERAQDQPLFFTEQDRQREFNWLTARAQRLCIQGRVGQNCAEDLAKLRPSFPRLPDPSTRSPASSRPAPERISALRHPDEREKALYDTALRLQDPRLCRALPAEIVAIGWSVEPGFLFQPLRSGCLTAVATSRRDGEICRGVQPVRRGDLDGDGLTPAYCQRSVEGWVDYSYRTTLKPNWPEVLDGLGYRIPDIPDDTMAAADEERRWLAFADRLLDRTHPRHAEFVARLVQHQSGSTGARGGWLTEANLRRHLYQLSVVRFHCSINRFGDRYAYNGYEIKPPAKFDTGFALTDHKGRAVTDRDFRGQFLMVYFGYTYCPDVCPTSLQTMSEAMDALGEAGDLVRPLFISIDPERDDLAQIADYVELFDPRLTGLTGTAQQVRRAAKNFQAYFFAGEVDGEYVVEHTSWTYLVGPDGRAITYFDHGAEPDAMAKRISQAIADRRTQAVPQPRLAERASRH